MDNINYNTPDNKALKLRILESVRTNPKVVERAVLVLWDNQTQDEQRDSDTKHNNLRGFNAADASRLSYYARWVRSGRSLTGNHLERARKGTEFPIQVGTPAGKRKPRYCVDIDGVLFDLKEFVETTAGLDV